MKSHDASAATLPALFQPRTALVTGASSGIGKAIAMRLAAEGCAVAVGYNSGRERAVKLAEALPSNGHFAVHIRVDDTASIMQAAAITGERFDALDALVNCGGATVPVAAGNLEGLNDDIFDKTVAVNLRGPFAVIRTFRPLLEAADRACIVNISSIAARTGIGSSLAYLAAKAGVDALTLALAKVLAPGIRVFSVSPAGVDTDFVPGRTLEQLQKTAERFPLAHVTSADDVARAAIACITHLTSATGIVVPVDEGRHL